MTNAPERIWAEEPEIFDGMGFWQESQSAGLIQYTRTDLAEAAVKSERDRILAILDAHPNGSPGWLALQIREGKL